MASDAKYYVNDFGYPIIVDTGQDLSTATVLSLLVKKPSGETLTWAGELGPANAYGDYKSISYTVQEGDIDEDGTWSLQAFVEFDSSFQIKGRTVTFRIYPEFK